MTLEELSFTHLIEQLQDENEALRQEIKCLRALLSNKNLNT